MLRKWSPAQEALDIITDEEWMWPRNVRCKYIELRIDTRDGHCIIKDREGKVITLQELQRQAGVKAKEPTCPHCGYTGELTLRMFAREEYYDCPKCHKEPNEKVV